MGLFDFFRRKAPPARPSFEQICYDIAYRLIPAFAFERGPFPERAEEVGPALYAMACNLYKISSDGEGARIGCHCGTLANGWRFSTLNFPPPPAIDLAGDGLAALQKLTQDGSPIVLAPHFASIVAAPAGKPILYFVLGQSPMGGGTTFRQVTENANANLGPGPEPVLEHFHERIVAHLGGKGATQEKQK